MKFLFKFIMFIIVLLLLVIAGIFAFAYFKYDINGFELFKEADSLSNEVNEEEIVLNPYTEDDLNMYNNLTNFLLSTSIVIEDKQIAAFVDKNYSDDMNSALPDGMTIKLLEFSFVNIVNQEDKWKEADFRIVAKLDLSELKEQLFNEFPASIIKDKVPDTLYITETIDIEATATGIQISSSDIKINQLESVENIFKLLAVFDESLSKENLANQVAEIVYDAFYGEDGVLAKLQIKGMTDYRFSQSDDKSYLIIYTIDTSISRNIYYFNLEDADNPNPSEYNILFGTLELVDPERNGYQFLGFYDSILYTNKVASIDTSKMVDVTLFAKWEVIVYKITLDLNGGEFTTDTPSIIEYTIESSDIYLPNNVTKFKNEIELQFKGWTGEELDAPATDIVIASGSFGDKTYTACFEGEEVVVTLKTLSSQTIISYVASTGEKLSLSGINARISDNLPGYSVSGVYTSSSLDSEFDLEKRIDSDVEIYCDLDYFVNTLLFYSYLDEFNEARQSLTLTIDSEEEFLAFVDYVHFYDVTEEIKLSTTYEELSGDLLKHVITIYSGLENGYKSSHPVVTLSATNGSLYYIDPLCLEGEASLVLDPEKTEVKEQLEYAFKTSFESSRDSEFDDFKINMIEKTLEVHSSNQLYYALMNGYRPTFASGSNVEKIYNDLKTILREVVDDTLTDIEKVHNIYEWLALNVSYDNFAASYEGEDSYKYDSWFIEGVLNNRKAVCEGYAKTLIALCAIEKIPAIFVTGNGHAWNRVYLEHNWYVVDATHADIITGDYEVFSNQQFMITDLVKEKYGFKSDNFSDFTADTEYNYYVEQMANGFSLYVNSTLNLNKILDYLKSLYIDGKYTFEIYTNKSDVEIQTAFSLKGLSTEGFMSETDYGSYPIKTFIMKKKGA